MTRIPGYRVQAMPIKDQDRIKSLAQNVLETEARAVTVLKDRIDGKFVRACEICLECQGRIVVIGMGKSGHIGSKIAATLASTGSPAFFVHPGEASHGDLGMITGPDVVLAISNSGETSELITILPMIKRLGVKLISMTGKPASTLSKAADVNLDVSVAEEACPLNLAPTASTTATLALGDALAVALLEARGFTEEDFARSHPSGSLGRRLLLHVGDLMHSGDQIPRIAADKPLSEGLLEMSRKGLGMTTVFSDDNHLEGVFTDGDLRRAIDDSLDLRTTLMRDVMTPRGYTISPELLAAEAVRMMQTHKITSLLVISEADELVGVLHIHDLLRAGVM